MNKSATSKGELVIHIGPPKTATTSLQHFFQDLKNEQIIYGGICQPRSNKDDSIGKKIYDGIVHRNQNKKEIYDFIKIKLDAGKSILISEEGFLVESDKITINLKLIELWNILKEFDPIILIVARDPKNVLPSYYTELYYRINSIKIKNYKDFINSSYCEIYKYLSLKKTILNIGFPEVIILEYEKLIDSRYLLSDIFKYVDLNEKIKLERKNTSKIVSGKRRAKVTSYKSLIRKKIFFLSKIPYLEKNFNKGYSKFIPTFSFLKLKGKSIDFDFSPQDIISFTNEYKQIINNR